MRSGDALHPATQTDAMGRAARTPRVRRRFVAKMRIKRAIAGDMVPQLRRIGPERIHRMGDRWKRFPVDHYRLGGFVRPCFGLRDDHNDGFSDKARAIDRQRVLSGNHSLGSVAVEQRHVRPDLRTASRMRNCL